MKHFMSKRRFIAIFCVLVIVFIVGPSGLLKFGRIFLPKSRVAVHEVIPAPTVREPWVTVFVHGSFCSLLGLLNVVDVVHDDVEYTAYKKVVGKMREDPFFYQEQPFMQRGLFAIKPTYDLAFTNGKKYGAYPLIRAYEQVTEWVKPNKEKNYFYTFGWSGLLSQRRRFKEAVRFYNSLNEELEKYYAQGIHPKVRVITHSHGGNMVTYLTVVERALFLQQHAELMDDILSNTSERMETLLDAKSYIDGLPLYFDALTQPRQKRWDYKPATKKFVIDELILWGMPVQPETDYMLSSKIFKKVYHCYSDEDLVQRIDWVSTKKHYSDRRLKKERMYSNFPGEENTTLNHLVQVRFMVGRNLKHSRAYAMHDGIGKDVEKVHKTVSKEEQSMLHDLFLGGSLLKPKTDDPTHRELWFFTWYIKKGQRKPLLAPLPLMVFSPLFMQLIDTQMNLSDVDINLFAKDKVIDVGLVKHGELELVAERHISRALLNDLTKKVEPWKSEEVSSQDIFNLIRRYADEI